VTSPAVTGHGSHSPTAPGESGSAAVALAVPAGAHNLAFNPKDRGAALEGDLGGGSLVLRQGDYPRRVSLALMSGDAKRYPRSRASSVSRFPEIARVIVNAQSQKCHRGAWNAA